MEAGSAPSRPRSADERPRAHGGDTARSILGAERGGLIDRHDLWEEADYAAAAQIRRVVEELGIDLVRLSFCDQHGTLRGKTLTRDGLAAALRDGCAVPSSLVLKDVAGASAYPVFTPGAGIGIEGLGGAGDLVLVPDPKSFRVLPWAPRTGWLLCEPVFPDCRPMPLSTRYILRRAIERIADRGFSATMGIELEFHLYRGTASEDDGGEEVFSPTSRGSQLLHEEDLDRLEPVVRKLHDGLVALDLPLRTIELEFGPSQLEVTLAPRPALQAADDALLCRSAIRQIARREGYFATFMSRPLGTETASTGWHLHQSLRDLDEDRNAFIPADGGAVLSSTGRRYLGGLLAHARAAAVFTTPTINGYKRYLPFSLAPERIVWGIDNKGAMIRAVGGPGDPATRLENRSGEPAANPYLYMASQLVCGLDGIAKEADPGAPTENPYAPEAPSLPGSLPEALDALEADPLFADAFGAEVVDWLVRLKRAEVKSYLDEVSSWEQRHYLHHP